MKKTKKTTPTGLENIVDDGTTTVYVDGIVKTNTYSSLDPQTKMVIAKDELKIGNLVKEVAPIEVIREVIKFVSQEVIKEVMVEKPRLEGFELYAKLRDIGFYQGGSMGVYMENPNGVDKVYVPHAQEVIGFFTGDPDKWEAMRDGIIRTYIEIYESNNG